MMSACTARSQANPCSDRMLTLVAYMQVIDTMQKTCLTEIDHAIKGCEAAGLNLPSETALDLFVLHREERLEREDPAAIVKFLDPENPILPPAAESHGSHR